MNNKISKSIILILKGILLWSTAITVIVGVIGIESIFSILGTLYTSILLITSLFFCYLCYKIISIDEFEKITFCKYFDINLKDE